MPRRLKRITKVKLRAWGNCQGAREEPLQEQGDEEMPEGEVGRD